MKSAHPHPTEKHHWVGVSDDKKIELFSIQNASLVGFNSQGDIGYTAGTRLSFMHTDDVVDDLSVIMKKRLKGGYGFNVLKNIDLLTEGKNFKNRNLRFVWLWAKQLLFDTKINRSIGKYTF
eukprot:UN27078